MSRPPAHASSARAARGVGVVIGLLAAFAIASCEDGETARECTDIPAGGCPLSRGVACSDPACEATYACLPGNVWELRERCPARPDAGAKDAAAPDALAPIDAAIDAPPGAYGGPGCGPLQAPDCALGTALSCPPGAGCCDCEDLFVCEDRGWTAWGTCSLDGGIRRP
ncbi:MAG: hypothetical protein JST00_26815 [Deltaproteobacteria bacterium]|nr:hypothetical protein [Deltaproteobacteria bacterium]